MKITGTFKTEKEHTIRVTFYNKRSTLPSININTSDDIFFGDEPVIITNEADDTFAHILKTQAKVTLVARSWLGDYLFADNAKSIVVNIWKDDVCIFAGYCSPNSFNQNFSHELEPIEINCVDTLTTLQNRRLTDDNTYEELVAQSSVRPFSWFFGKMNLEDPAGVIPNLPDYPVEEMHIWVETSWTRMINNETNEISYYAIESECVVLDEETAVATGDTRIGSYKTTTYIQSEDTCIVDGIQYYKKYAWITINGEDVNTGDWIVGDPTDEMPYVVSTRNEIDGWTNGVLPQPFDFYEHYTTYNTYSNGMEIAVSDGIGDNIPEYPSTTSHGSYYEFRQGSADDVDVDEDTGYIYYKDYAWVCVNNECTNSGQWQRGAEKSHPAGTHTAITGWQYNDPAVAFEYYETISHYIDYSDGTSELDYTTMGHQIPLTPNTTANGSYYEFRQGGADDLDIDQTTGFEYYKEYAWVIVNGVAEQTTNWRRGQMYYNGYNEQYLTIEATSSGNVTITLGSNLTTTDLTSFSYSKDQTNWTTWNNDGNGTNITVAMDSGDKLYLKGSGQRYHHTNEYSNTTISTTCNADIYGNIMSLLYGDNFVNSYTVYSYSFQGLFGGQTHITNIENLVLPATTLANYCYSYMFFGCTALTTVPVLPATTLAEWCYEFMFSGCTALTTAPVLPATTLANYCYSRMFSRCTALTTAPALPATTLAHFCYSYMFFECTSLTTAPALPATTLISLCYECMFWGCTALTTAPVLPATTLAEWCYGGMFRDCTSLTTAPELPATTLADHCYSGMFKGCSNLSSITMLATNISASGCLNDWVNGVAASGTFTKAASMTTLPTGANGIPSGWTVVDAA